MKRQTNYRNSRGRSLIPKTNKKNFSKTSLKMVQKAFNLALRISELALVNFNISHYTSKCRTTSLKVAIESLKLALVCLEIEKTE